MAMLAGVPAASGVVLALGNAAFAAVVPPGGSATTSGWHVQTEFDRCSTDTGGGQVLSVSATGPANAWAAGTCVPPALIAHWNGKSWREVQPPAGSGQASAVASLSGSYTWTFLQRGAVLSTHDFALLRHDGRWTAFQLADNSSINSAVVFSRSDAWGFGTVGRGAYAVRYNGRSWRRVAIPVVPLATAAPKPDNIWAVGPAVGQSHPQSYQLAHWTGRWQVRPLPKLSLPAQAGIAGVSVVGAGPGAVFVAVEVFPQGGVLLQWNGTRWSNVPLPVPVSFLGPLAHDGHGGLWVASVPTSGNPAADVVMLHRSPSGAWLQSAAVHTNCGDCQLIVNAMRLIPGTGSVWAGGVVVVDCNDFDCLIPVIIEGP
jgi:hypothetical protein